MQLTELYRIAVTNTSEILTDEQENFVFLQSCLIFFGKVKVKVELDLSNKTYDEAIEELKREIGDFKVKMKTKQSVINNKMYVFIEPKEYTNFDLDTNYSADFIKVCEFVILQTSLKNNMLLKNAGIQGFEVPQTNYQEIEDLLSKKYSISVTSTITNDRD